MIFPHNKSILKIVFILLLAGAVCLPFVSASTTGLYDCSYQDTFVDDLSEQTSLEDSQITYASVIYNQVRSQRSVSSTEASRPASSGQRKPAVYGYARLYQEFSIADSSNQISSEVSSLKDESEREQSETKVKRSTLSADRQNEDSVSSSVSKPIEEGISTKTENILSDMLYEEKIIDIIDGECADISNTGTDIVSYSSDDDVRMEKMNAGTLRVYLNTGISDACVMVKYSNGKTEDIHIKSVSGISNDKIQVGSTVTYSYNKEIKSASAVSGGEHVNISFSKNTVSIEGVSASTYSLDNASATVKVEFADGKSSDLTVIVAWPLYATDPYYRNGKWSYDGFIPTGIVSWGGKRFSWYTMLATHENATGVSWELPITNNPGNILSYLPQSDWNRLAEMQKTNSKATMQHAFKPWSTDSVYWVDEGFIRDNQGYIVVAAPLNLLNNGTVKRMQVIATPWGPARIYDACPEGSWDIWVRSHEFSGFFNYDIVKRK